MELLGGPLFAVAGAGESHGPGVTTIVFGCPAGLYLSRAEIQAYLNQRRPGSSRHGTPRQEKDRVFLLLSESILRPYTNHLKIALLDNPSAPITNIAISGPFFRRGFDLLPFATARVKPLLVRRVSARAHPPIL